MTWTLDVRWPLTRPGRIPSKHHYPLLAVLSRIVPVIHRAEGVGIHSIAGVHVAPGVLELNSTSAITVRTPAAFLPALMPLSGKKLDLGGCPIRLGVPQLFALTPCDSLLARSVTIKGYTEPAEFHAALRRQLDALGVRASVDVEIGRRRVLAVRQHTIVCFQVVLRGLLDEESILVQAQGVGGRRHLGSGLFLPNHCAVLQQAGAKE